MQPFFDLLVGKPVSHVWFGHGAALFLELGNLTENRRHNGTIGNPKGVITVMADFGWRVEGLRSIVCGSANSEQSMIAVSQKLLGASVLLVQTCGRIPELQMDFSNSLWLLTFSQYQGQPSWTILFNSPALGSLSVRRGKVTIDPSSANKSFKADGLLLPP